MFWAYNTTSPQIDIILCKEDLTLQELLDQENVLQELKAQNLKLIEFLIKPEVLRELVTLITTEPSSDTDLSEQYRYPNLACELLTSDLPALNERLASEEILNKLYCFLQNDPPLNPLLSSYFSRTLSILISRKSEQNWFSYQYTCLQALEFLKAKDEFIELLFKHMGTSSIMDLMHNLVTLIEGPELKQSLWSWLQSQNVIPSLICLLGPCADGDCQTNTASLLCSIIQKLRDNLIELNDKSVSDPILHLLESAEVMELLLNSVFGSDTLCDTSIESGVNVLLTLMYPYLPGDARCRQTLNYTVHDKMDSGLVIPNNNTSNNNRSNSTSDWDEPNDQQPVPPSDIIKVILPFISKFKHILLNPLKKEAIKLTSGVICPPFGKARLVLAKLMGALISLNSSEINEEIMRCDISELLLDLFYAYSSNNFLHTEVEKLIAHTIDHVNGYTISECNDDLVLIHLLKKCDLLRRLLDIWKENQEGESSGRCRRGYMGHVIRIATLIHIETGKSLIFNELLTKECTPQTLSDWNAFVNGTLKEVIEKHSTCLGGIRPKLCQDNSFEESVSSKESKLEFKDFDQDDDSNVIFSNDPTLMAYGEENYRRSNGLTDDEEERLERQTRMFDLVCAQKWQSFTKGLDTLDDNEEGKETLSWPPVDGYRNWDSDEEYAEEDAQNSLDPWAKLGNVSDPWSTSASNGSGDGSWNSSGDANWAKFDENFGEVFSTSDSNDAAHSRSTTHAADVDSSNESQMLNEFSDVNISGEQTESPTQLEASNGASWSESPMKEDNPSGEYVLRPEYDCFGRQGKHGADEMLNLESISGNTLLEKIANAENDIRNQDEEEQQQQHLQNNRRFDSFDEASESIMCNSGECDVRVRLTGCSVDEMTTPEEGRAYEQNAGCLSQMDCLTENSFDFVTAENSTSDAESSMEFADAENSLELEEEDAAAERACGSPADELPSSPSENDCEPLTQAVDEVPTNNECNNVQGLADADESGDVDTTGVEAESSAPLRSSMNGVVAEHAVLKDCDKYEDAYDSSGAKKEEPEAKRIGSVIEEPA